jgi:hypothetical protein
MEALINLLGYSTLGIILGAIGLEVVPGIQKWWKGRKLPKTKAIKPEVKPLVVGREYMVRDAEKNWRRLIYFGVDASNTYTFLDASNGSGVGIVPAGGKSERLFVNGDVRWLEEQSPIERGRVDKGRD